MNRRTNILAHLRRLRTGARRYVLASFAVAYLSAGLAPCAAAANPATANPAMADTADSVHEHNTGPHDSHDHGGTVTHVGHDQGAEREGRTQQCPHCPLDGAMRSHGEDHSSCFALDDLADVAAPQAKAAPPSLVPLLASAAFTLPPPLSSTVAPPPLCTARVAVVPLNVRHCVFLI